MTIAAPLAVGVMMVAIWEIACRAFNIPVLSLPQAERLGAKLVSDWPALLGGAVGMTLRIALQAFVAAIVIGTSSPFCSCRAGQSR